MLSIRQSYLQRRRNATRCLRFVLAAACFACGFEKASSANGRVLPRVDRLTEASDVVVVGEITEISVRSEAYREREGRKLRISQKTGEIAPVEILKGDVPLGHIFVNVTETFDAAGGTPPSLPLPRKCRMMFLKRSDSGFEFAAAFPGSLPALCTAQAEGALPIDRVVSQVLLVLTSSGVSTADKLEALSSLYLVENSQIPSALDHVFDNDDLVLHIQLISERLRRNQVAALPEAIRLLSRTGDNIPKYLLPNLDYAIRDGVRAKEAIPFLIPLLRSHIVEDRRAAASALRNIGTPQTIGPLKTALFDTDLDVQYYSVMGLANMTDQQDWLPNAEDFRSEHAKFIGYWRAWAQNH